MMKFSLAVVVLGVTSLAQAGGFEKHVARDRACQMIGDVSMAYYDMAQKKEPYDISMIDKSKGYSEMLLESINYAYHKALSSDDAYMTGWAKCQDRFDLKHIQ